MRLSTSRIGSLKEEKPGDKPISRVVIDLRERLGDNALSVVPKLRESKSSPVTIACSSRARQVRGVFADSNRYPGRGSGVPTIRGKVVSGMGNFSLWIEKLRDHYLRKTGMLLFPGTLNLQLEKPWFVPPGCLHLESPEYGGTVTVNIVPCSIFGRPAFILRTGANEEGRGHHPKTIIEIATDMKLRDTYRLQDGDSVEVEIAGEAAGA